MRHEGSLDTGWEYQYLTSLPWVSGRGQEQLQCYKVPHPRRYILGLGGETGQSSAFPLLFPVGLADEAEQRDAGRHEPCSLPAAVLFKGCWRSKLNLYLFPLSPKIKGCKSPVSASRAALRYGERQLLFDSITLAWCTLRRDRIDEIFPKQRAMIC